MDSMNYINDISDMGDMSDAKDTSFVNLYNQLYQGGQTYNDFQLYSSQPFHYGLHEDSFLPDTTQLFFQSEPLSRHNSSAGSTYTCSTPASPMFSGSPCGAVQESTMTLLQGSPYSTDMDAPTPEGSSASSFHGSPDMGVGREFTSPMVMGEDSPTISCSTSGRDYPVCCLHPGCDAKPFKRRADLDRHYKHRHAPDSLKEAYHCDYPRCGRRRDPFHRRDHFRDHLRDFHKEDIEKRGVLVKEEWLEGRNTAQSWWRCTKCLKRISISRFGYDCPTCKTSCQAKRKEARRRE